ncbi:MAG TPA: hypothetical protein PLI79_08970 [Mycobacterium sp.]|jgi:hypothetical protein|nr:hypothetical protein [Mycobacterium sp.]MCB0944505.1 hypothetical protein [Mycobacterium sp.]TXI42536.1 MAG: hypothetical protein E6Q57_14875 [Mycobacterium sp.]HMZ15858.1 hypothetical protein [Mycobacterium sp.]HNA51709.1 hypothetical protein [Mycobacterium sp.]
MAEEPALSLDRLSESEMAALIFRITDELSARGTREGFAELLRVVAYVGERVGDTARLLAASNSWSQVAEISGTSKQAAWERWRMS